MTAHAPTSEGGVMADHRTIDDPVVEVIDLTKAFGDQLAVDSLTFSIGRGRVTGFLGPNGAGKTTTLRMLLGLAAPTRGEALVLGRRFVDLEHPARAVGALIDASGFHPGRRARHELAIQAAATGIDDERVEVVLEEVGLAAAASKRVGEFSLGMRQRLGLAAALLGDPELLILDEPANGLDPAGIRWLRELLRAHAGRGAAVLVSSHVLSELALVAEDVIVLDRGRLVAQSAVADLVGSAAQRVYVETPDGGHLRPALMARGAEITEADAVAGDGFVAVGLTAGVVGAIAAATGAVLHQLRTETQSLEEIFLGMTSDERQIR
jgi:ABC-2 type transport system ATP-binding protein